MFLKMDVNKTRGCKIWEQISYELELSEKKFLGKKGSLGNTELLLSTTAYFCCCCLKRQRQTLGSNGHPF